MEIYECVNSPASIPSAHPSSHFKSSPSAFKSRQSFHFIFPWEAMGRHPAWQYGSYSALKPLHPCTRLGTPKKRAVPAYPRPLSAPYSSPGVPMSPTILLGPPSPRPPHTFLCYTLEAILQLFLKWVHALPQFFIELVSLHCKITLFHTWNFLVYIFYSSCSVTLYKR